MGYQRTKTFVMRSKEEAADYRYFPDPDLPLVKIDIEKIELIKNNLPELPDQKLVRLCTMGLKPYEAEILIDDIELSNYFEASAKHTSSKQLINWILRNLIGYLKEAKIQLSECKVTPEKLASLVNLIDKGVINSRSAQEIFIEVANTGKNPETLVKELGLEQIGSEQEIEAMVKSVIDSNSKQVAEYKSGNQKLYGFFVGQVMAKTKGKGNPQVINELLKKYLA